MTKQSKDLSVIMLGATGAVGGEALKALLKMPPFKSISLLGRREVKDVSKEYVAQHKVDIFKPETYNGKLANYDVAICTLGVGEPSKVSKEDFVKIDKLAVIDFAKACKQEGVKHFQLLASVSIDAKSRSFYLRTKGELVEALKALNFERLSIFKPSMILTPTNRYGLLQGITLAVWPILDKLFVGSANQYKGIKVKSLGRAFAENIFVDNIGYEELTWRDFQKLTES